MKTKTVIIGLSFFIHSCNNSKQQKSKIEPLGNATTYAFTELAEI